MTYKIIIYNKKKWKKDFSKLSKAEREMVSNAILDLRLQPWSDDLHVKKLVDYKYADYRLRIGNWRILFNRDKENKRIILFRVRNRESTRRGSHRPRR